MTQAEINAEISKFIPKPYGFDIPHNSGITFDMIHSCRKHINTPQLKVKYLNNLRNIVSRRLPRNKMGQAIVSDYDLVNASAEEHCETFMKVMDLWKE